MVFFSLNLSDRRGVSFYRVFFLPSFPALSGATHFSGGNSIDTRVNLSSKCVWYIFFWNFISSSELIFTEFFFYRVFRNRLRLRLKIPFKTGAAFICFVFQLYRVFLFFFFLPSFAESFVDRVPLNWISFDSVSLLTRSSFNCELRNELLINYDQFTGFLPSFRGFLGFL